MPRKVSGRSAYSRTLHEKVDHLLLDQWARMTKIQELQIELLEELKGRQK